MSLGTGDIFKLDAFEKSKSWEVGFDKKTLTEAEVSFKFGPYEIKPTNMLRRPLLCDPQNYVGKFSKTKIVNEDDILHEEILKDFNGNISQEEAEQLFTFLTTPYLRIPLVLDFFARERVGCLFDATLRSLLEQTLFVPGRWGKINQNDGRNVEQVPCDPELLNTNHGYLVAELERGPLITLKSFHHLLVDGLKLSVGDYKSSFVSVLLFLFKTAIKMIAFIQDTIVENTSNENDVLVKYDLILTKWMNEALVLIQKWLKEAEKDSAKHEASILHAHIGKLLFYEFVLLLTL
jgi:hypothetical protein|tara:strand:- start:1609 stop:2484 length:876 start_codon:yes stop_codon:yes gene_type:complete